MASKIISEQKKKAALKAKRRREREALLPKRSTTCEVCRRITKGFNARINIKTPKGYLLTIGICGDCVRNGYTFDKEATVIQKQV